MDNILLRTLWMLVTGANLTMSSDTLSTFIYSVQCLSRVGLGCPIVPCTWCLYLRFFWTAAEVFWWSTKTGDHISALKWQSENLLTVGNICYWSCYWMQKWNKGKYVFIKCITEHTYSFLHFYVWTGWSKWKCTFHKISKETEPKVVIFIQIYSK